MLRLVYAIVAGFVTMSVIVTAGTFALVAALVPGGLARMRAMRDNPDAMPAPTPRYMAANLILSFLAAVAGGRVADRIAGADPRNALIGLGVLVLAMGTLSAMGRGSERQPAWYRYLIPVIGVAGIAANCLLPRG